MSGRAFVRPSAALGAAVLLSGCALQIGDGLDRMSGVARYATAYDHVEGAGPNLIDRALADCSEKTAKAETACVRQALDDARLGKAALIALVPGCRAGQVCRYDRTTRDRLGFVRASATVFVRNWRVELDFRRPAAGSAEVPVTVTDRDAFESTPPPKPKAG